MEEDFVRHVQEVSPFAQVALAQLVAHYEGVILSKRRSSAIRKFEELVTLLMKRDVIDPSDRASWDELNSLCQKFVGRPFSQEPPVPPNRPPNADHTGTAVSSLNPKVVEYLCSNITLSWRNFARALKLKQGDIDSIESKWDRNYSQCIKEVLLTYESRMHFASASGGDAVIDIYKALELLQKPHLLEQYRRLTGMKLLHHMSKEK